MQLAFSTVVRSAPQERGGEILLLDWDSKSITHRAAVVATDPVIDDPNPRGNSRGARGILVRGDEIWVASYHSLLCFDRSLRPQRRISHPLFAGLHEIAPGADDVLWLAATAIDAAVAVRLPDGAPAGDLHPRETPGIARAVGVTPNPFDKSVDNRLLHLTRAHQEAAGHLHLNAVRVIDGDVHALFNKAGAVGNLSADRIVLTDPDIEKAHNLVLAPDGRRFINDTRGAVVRIYRPDWTLERTVTLRDKPWVEELMRGIRRRERMSRVLRRGRSDASIARPLFLRGLAIVDADHVVVGISPATLLLLDVTRGTLEDRFEFSPDVHTAIHGLALLPDA